MVKSDGNFWKIYLIRNIVNDKGYVGLTSKRIENRLNEHFRSAFPGRKRDDGTLFPFHAAIQKYGNDNFCIEVLEADLPLERAKKRETYWIRKLRTHATAHRQGYNASWGGEELDTWHPVAGKYCPRCGSVLERRRGYRGEFIGCSAYPKCNITFSIEQIHRGVSIAKPPPKKKQGAAATKNATKQKQRRVASTNNAPSKNSKVWSESDDNLLAKLINSNQSVKKISETLKKSDSAVRMRMKKQFMKSRRQNKKS